MSEKTVYLAGKMTGLTHDEMNKWRVEIKDKITDISNRKVVNPVEHFQIGGNEAEAHKYDLYRLRNSNLVIVNMNHINSLGTSWELGVANELGIPIIGLCDDKNSQYVHSWWKLSALYIANSVDDLIRYFDMHFCTD